MRSHPKTVRQAKSLRRRMSPPEVRLWVRVRERIQGRPVIHRQYPFGPYILDFFCPAARVAIEVDGWVHGLSGQQARDERRDALLLENGIETVRITGADVMGDPDGAAEWLWDLVIRRAAERASSTHHHPSGGPPPSLREGGVESSLDPRPHEPSVAAVLRGVPPLGLRGRFSKARRPVEPDPGHAGEGMGAGFGLPDPLSIESHDVAPALEPEVRP